MVNEEKLAKRLVLKSFQNVIDFLIHILGKKILKKTI